MYDEYKSGVLRLVSMESIVVVQVGQKGCVSAGCGKYLNWVQLGKRAATAHHPSNCSTRIVMRSSTEKERV